MSDTITKPAQLAKLVEAWFTDNLDAEEATLTITLKKGASYTLSHASRESGALDLEGPLEGEVV